MAGAAVRYPLLPFLNKPRRQDSPVPGNDYFCVLFVLIMTETRAWFLVNPVSGVLPAARRKEILAYIRSRPGVRCLETRSAGHATELAAQAVAEGIGKVIAVGGDGTVNEVAKGLVGSDAALGIVAIGSGNGLARHLKRPLKPLQAIDEALAGTSTRLIDTCYLEDIPFFCTAGVGFDAYVADAFSRQQTRGLSTYVKTTISSFRSYRPGTYGIESREGSREVEAFSLTFANAGQYGNDAWIAPEARLDDGQIDLSILRPFPFFYAPVLGARLFGKSIAGSPYRDRLSGGEFCLSSDQPLLLHYDGEPLRLEQTSVRVSIRPLSLKIIA